MRIWKYLSADHIFLDAPCEDKETALKFAADSLFQTGAVKHAQKTFEALLAREKLMSTGIGSGIGIPHALTHEAFDLAIILIRPEKPIDFNALDGKPVDIIIPLVVPENETTLHLRALAGISGLCKKAGFLQLVRKAKDPELLSKEIKETEEKGI